MIYRLLIAGALLVITEAYSGRDLPPGPYCGKYILPGGQCCDGRKDTCSHEIRGTLCYCDVFCNRNGSYAHDDCCPDYQAVCLGEIAPEPIKSCEHNNIYYHAGERRRDNCNECKCVGTAPGQAEWECTRDPCLVSQDIIDSVNQRRLSWRASNYSQFWGKKLSDGIKYKLGTMPLSPQTLRMIPIRHPDDLVFPASFDSRSRWPQYISPVYDQGWCGSDWAVSTAAVASDRFGIQSNGAENVRLSAQQLLSCARRGQMSCAGGHIDKAWHFSRKFGLVDEACLPYVGANSTQCPRNIQHQSTLQAAGCRAPANVPRTERYKTTPPSRLAKETDIMYDIMNSGPVQAVMTVYPDFFHYRDGVYRRSQRGGAGAGRLQGHHSVRVIGWGEERGDKYWLVANSWGEEWGENGYFRIARGADESGIESFVIAVLARVMEANDTYRK